MMFALATLPWLQGFQPVAVDDHGSRQVTAEMEEWRAADHACVSDAYEGLTITADLTPAKGDETVLASFAQGLLVLDHDRHLVAQAPGLPCEGSADELVALAAGDAWIGMPVIALAATRGGHAESVTTLTLYRVGDGGQLEPIFSGAVEQHADNATRTGIVALFPGGLVFRPPTGETVLWLYDPAAKRYVAMGDIGVAA